MTAEQHDQAVSHFEGWWDREGKVVTRAMPAWQRDKIKTLCMIAWSNGAYCAIYKTKNGKSGIREIPSEIMMSMPPSWRKKWCDSQACACTGCANVSGGLSRAGFTKKDHLNWMVSQND